MVAGSNSRKDMELTTYKHSYDEEKQNGKSHIPDVEVAHAVKNSKHAEPESNLQDDENYNWCCKLELCTYLNIAFFAIVGCLTRLGLDHLLGAELANIENSSTIIFQSFFSNMLGSFILGVLSSSLLKEIKELSSLSTGISTGLCGSITTYSKWNQQVSLLMVSRADPTGQPQLTALAAIAVGLATAVVSFEVGKDFSVGFRKSFRRSLYNIVDDYSSTLRCSTIIVCCLLVASWVTLIALSIVYSSRQKLFTTLLCGVFAPFGAILRFVLGKLNSKSCCSCLKALPALQAIPWGTFAANFIGSILIAVLNVILTWVPMSCVSVGCVNALSSGFLACLTTVSTFVSEISGFRGKNRRRVAHTYAVFTLVVCQAVAALINGVNYRLLEENSRLQGNDSLPDGSC